MSLLDIGMVMHHIVPTSTFKAVRILTEDDGELDQCGLYTSDHDTPLDESSITTDVLPNLS